MQKTIESERTTFTLPDYLWEAFDLHAVSQKSKVAALCKLIDGIEEARVQPRFKTTMRHFRLPIKYKLKLAKLNTQGSSQNMNSTLREIMLLTYAKAVFEQSKKPRKNSVLIK